MTRDDQVLALLGDANPVLDADEFVAALGAPLEVPDNWSGEMTDTIVRSDVETARRRAGWGPAAAVAAALLVAVGVAGIWSSAAEDPIADSREIAAVLRYFEVQNSGDLAAFNALRGPDAFSSNANLDQVLMNLNTMTIVDGCTEAGPAPAGGQLVTCNVTDVNDFLSPAGIELAIVRTLRVAADGTILSDEAEVDFAAGARYASAFWNWLRSTHPQVYVPIAPRDIQDLPGLRTDPADVFVALEYVDEFIAQSDEYPLPDGS